VSTTVTSCLSGRGGKRDIVKWFGETYNKNLFTEGSLVGSAVSLLRKTPSIRYGLINKIMELIAHLIWRYATKKFDPTRKISLEALEQLKEVIYREKSGNPKEDLPCRYEWFVNRLPGVSVSL
jgi:hypothetical protein